jgi:hypothetical protein
MIAVGLACAVPALSSLLDHAVEVEQQLGEVGQRVAIDAVSQQQARGVVVLDADLYGERSNDAGLVAAFTRRAGPPIKEYKPNRAERRALAERRRERGRPMPREVFKALFEETVKTLEAEGKLISEIGPDGVKRWIATDRL